MKLRRDMWIGIAGSLALHLGVALALVGATTDVSPAAAPMTATRIVLLAGAGEAANTDRVEPDLRSSAAQEGAAAAGDARHAAVAVNEAARRAARPRNASRGAAEEASAPSPQRPDPTGAAGALVQPSRAAVAIDADKGRLSAEARRGSSGGVNASSATGPSGDAVLGDASGSSTPPTEEAPAPGAVSGLADPDGAAGASAAVGEAIVSPGGVASTTGDGVPGGRAGAGGAAQDGAGAGRDARALLARALAASAQRCYPAQARRRRLRGEVTVAFCLDAAGRATRVEVEEGSGAAVLDRAAVQCVVPGALPLAGIAGCYRVPVRFGEGR